MEPTVLRQPANRRRVLQASAATAFALAMGGRAFRAMAQGVELSREYEGTTLNLLMEDLLETTAIEDMLPEFTEATGINVNFEKVNYGVMHEKLVPQLAAGEGNGSYDVLEVDFYWINEFARSGWMTKLDELIAGSNGALNLDNYIPATLKIGSEVDGSVYYIPMYPYPMGLIYRTDLVDNADFAAAYKGVAGKDLALPTSVEEYVAMATAVSQSGQDIYGAAMQAQQVDPIVMEFCNFLYGAGGDYYNAEMTEPIINQELGVKIAQLYADCVNNAAQPGAAGADLNDTMATYMQGKAFSMISYLFMLNAFNDSEDSQVKGMNALTVMPGGTGLTGLWSWGIPVSSPNPGAAGEFLKWVESPDIVMRRALAGGVAAQKAPYENPEYIEKYPWMSQALDLIETGKGLPAVTKQASLVEIMGRYLSECVSGAKSAQEAMDGAAAELKDLL